MTAKKRKSKENITTNSYIQIKADALTGFIAGFLIGIMGMYVYAIVLTNIG